MLFRSRTRWYSMTAATIEGGRAIRTLMISSIISAPFSSSAPRPPPGGFRAPITSKRANDAAHLSPFALELHEPPHDRQNRPPAARPRGGALSIIFSCLSNEIVFSKVDPFISTFSSLTSLMLIEVIL